ncbi:hypothetical protein N646_2687 [Vibrio alginolyticus NBRC 15630 = ATCC 17749]|uniref:Uncharacterized protein n=1 Tax=Vibrio alginolyticus (strain ATCC 17749 / DSM 2171 / NBRC 15630 / NCIMB 1903 / NCTC 12160 / XII-53) TaxID=1219076 RepID=A0A2I3CEX9_VIBAX|nr:hypothetical protein N646_2687 [Vibrio alginolyticus NBRC 15630 = ATCC 17749]
MKGYYRFIGYCCHVNASLFLGYYAVSLVFLYIDMLIGAPT